MKILIIGGGGREHALAEKLLENDKVDKVYLSKENGNINPKIQVKIMEDHREIIKFVKKENIYLTIVGPENYLSEGIVDSFIDEGLLIFGPSKKSAQLESSKEFSKKFMKKYNIPTADYISFTDYDGANQYSKNLRYPQVIKADGLCEGKGVLISQTREDSERFLYDVFHKKIFGDQGNRVIFEEYLDGPEVSLLCFVSGNQIYPMETSMDYKKIYDGDQGANTGGVGCISPNPYWNRDLEIQSDSIIAKIELGLKNENLSYSGVLFIGYIIENGQLKVLEFNTRFGDPETQVILPRLDSDLLKNFEEAIKLDKVSFLWKDEYAITVIATSFGYPKEYEKDKKIIGLNKLDSDLLLYHNGTKYKDGNHYTNGGRVLSPVGLGKSLTSARNKVYKNISEIDFEGISYRMDIGKF